MRRMRNAFYARDNFDVRRGGRGFSCAVQNTIISQKDAVDIRTFRVKPNTPKLFSMPVKNGGQNWDLPSISMVLSEIFLIDIIALLANGLSRTPTPPVDDPVLFLQAEAVTSWNPSGRLSY